MHASQQRHQDTNKYIHQPEVSLKNITHGGHRSANFLFTTASLKKMKKRKSQGEMARRKLRKKNERRRVKMERDRTEKRTQREWDVVERSGSLFTLQDLWRPAYAVRHGSRRLLAGGSNIISSSSARCALKCPAKKRTAAEYQQNALTFSPTTAVFISTERPLCPRRVRALAAGRTLPSQLSELTL